MDPQKGAVGKCCIGQSRRRRAHAAIGGPAPGCRNAAHAAGRGYRGDWMGADVRTRTLAAVTAAAVPVGVTALRSRPDGLRLGDFGVGDALRIARPPGRAPVVITLDLTRPLRPEQPGVAALATRDQPTLRQVLDCLAWAAADGRVVGLLARVGGALPGLATIQELAAAVRRFAASGRPAIAHAETFGEGGNGTPAYLLASAFDEVQLQPTGDLALLGVAGEVTFVRGALDRVGIDPQFAHRHEYKNAADAVTGYGFTDAHREALDSVVDDWAGQIVAAIADARRLDAADVRAAVDEAPLLADEALARGLVDRLAYLDETVDDMRSRVDADAKLVPLPAYHDAARARARWHERNAPLVALIDASGPITVRGGGVMAGRRITSDRLCADLRRVADDDAVAAVIMRIDSPGGSAVASDAIHRAIHRLRDDGTPVVAWLGDVAGSGGYYIAMPADHLVARPGTLTGSIGVVAGKAVRVGLEDRLGIRTEAVTRGAHARFYSSAAGFDDSERQRLDRQLDRIYDDFTSRVARDRGMSRAQVERVARGRIWTGAQAHANGLVDRLGGRDEVLAAVRDALGLPPDAPLRVHRHPPARGLLARLRDGGPADPAQRDVLAPLAAAAGEPHALTALLDELSTARGTLSMPWVPRLR